MMTHTMALHAPIARRTTATYAQVVEDELAALTRYCRYLAPSGADADELVSETLERGLRRWRRYDPARASARAWLCAIATSAAADAARAARRRRAREERAATPAAIEDTPADEGFSPALVRALATLSVGERAVIALRVVLELSGTETARITGQRPGAVASQLARALAKLRAALDADTCKEQP